MLKSFTVFISNKIVTNYKNFITSAFETRNFFNVTTDLSAKEIAKKYLKGHAKVAIVVSFVSRKIKAIMKKGTDGKKHSVRLTEELRDFVLKRKRSRRLNKKSKKRSSRKRSSKKR